MTLLDATLILTCGLAFLRWPLSTPIALAAAVLLVGATLIAEGWRHPLLPAYLACAGLIVAAFLPVERAATWLQWLGLVGGVMALVLSVAACIVLPQRRFPVPGGPYDVGTVELSPALLERFLPKDRAAPRVQLWFPVKPLPPQNWLARQFAPHEVRPAVIGAAPAAEAGRMPVLLYFAGWPGTDIHNFVLIRELSSRGFFVASLIYPGKLPSMSDADFARSVANFKEPYDFSTDAAAKRTMQLFEERVRNGARDASAMLDLLGSVERDGALPPFHGRLDLDHAGVFGFSMGGATAAQSGWLDPRFKAVANLDGRLWDESLHEGVSQPYLYISEVLIMPTTADFASTNLDTRYNAQLDQVDYTNLAVNLARHGGLQVTISGMAHLNFSDMNLKSPLRRYRQGGPIDRFRALEVVDGYVCAFFERELQGKAQPWLDGDSERFSEAKVKAWPAPPAEAPRVSENSATPP